KNALLIPASAVQGRSVRLVKDNRIVTRPIEIGAKTPETVEIIKGIEPGDLVVRAPSPSPDLDQHVKIRIENWQGQ
ncbi:MAG TPA: hypothetical protein VIF12_07215, partial [Micavibrio sp.]